MSHANRQRGGVEERLKNWFERMLLLCKEEVFAQQFRQTCPIEGAHLDDYRHHLLDVHGGVALVGLRCRGGNHQHLFVDLLGHCGCTLRQAISHCTDVYSHLKVRVVRTTHFQPSLSGNIDQLYLAAYVSQLDSPTQTPLLQVCEEKGQAAVFVAACYKEYQQSSPWFSRSVFPCDAEELRSCEWVFDILYRGQRAGLIALKQDHDRVFDGCMVMEEVVHPTFSGRGLAAEAQRQLQHYLSPSTLVFGTIDAKNTASIRTALSAGREVHGAMCWHSRPPLPVWIT